jgi:hypothetical protein
MAWVRFLSAYAHKPKPSVTIVYKAGSAVNVTRTCAERAVEKGCAVKVRKTAKNVEPIEDAGQGEV